MSRRARVLLIEDDPGNVELVRLILSERPDVDVLTAPTGEAGLALAALEHPDLILQDMHLPDMHGREILSRLRNDPATATTPVVILTGSVDEVELDQAKSAGASAHLMKPYDYRELIALIDPYLKEGSACG